MRMSAIGENTIDVAKWNPKTEAPDDEFIYIDIASVSQDRKQVNGVSRLLGCDAPSRARQLVCAGDVVVSTVRPNLNAVAYIPEDLDGATASTGFTVLRSDARRLNSRYLYHWVRSQEFVSNMVKLATGQSYPAVSDKIVKQSEIPFPPLDEQKRIAEILDQADALRRLRQHAIDRVNTLGRAIFHEMFGDPKANPKGFRWVELGDVSKFYSGNTLPDGEPFSEQSDGHLILKVSDLNHLRNQQDVVCAASWSASPGSRAGTCPPGALVFPKRGGAIGTNKKRWLKRSAILDPNLMGVHPDRKELTMSFLNGWFQTFNLSDIASGSSVPQLNKKDLAPLKVALPPVAEQVEYSRRIEALSMVRENALNSASHDEELFQVLQHRAFRGEL